MSVKFYALRDSAVAVLRKAGIKREDYSKHLVVKVLKSREEDGADITLYGADVHLEHKMSELDAAVESKVAEVPPTHSDNLKAAATTIEAAANFLKGEARDLEKEEAAAKGNPFNGLVKGDTKETLKKVSKPAATKKAPKADKKTAAKKTVAKKERAKGSAARNGISDWIRGLIEAGKTNKEIIDAAPKAGFDLTGKKAYFPAWYRWDMKQKAAKAAAAKATAKASKSAKA